MWRAYERGERPVVFVDESHRLNPALGTGFYTLTGVAIAREDLVDARRDLLAAGRSHGAKPWHTTEAYEEGRHEQIERVVATVARVADRSIVTVEVPVDGNTLEHERAARRVCLERLGSELTKRPEPPDLIVMDGRSDAGNRDDLRTAAEMRGQRIIARGTVLAHSTDHAEPLLTAPDAVGWAGRRLLAREDPRWIAPVKDSLVLMHAHTGEWIDIEALTQRRQDDGHLAELAQRARRLKEQGRVRPMAQPPRLRPGPQGPDKSAPGREI